MARGFETYDIEGMGSLLKGLGQPAYRTRQVLEWAYGRGAAGYDEMTNLPSSLRIKLAEEVPYAALRVANKQTSTDGTRKYVFELADGCLIESVGIPSRERDSAGEKPARLTVCFSTQVGCSFGCMFCATGTQGFTRNLHPGEIAQQVVSVAKDFGVRASNAVAMGQGEPFANYDCLLGGLRLINADFGPGVGARHITVSTCGIAEGIRRFGSESEQFTLAVSLHSAIQRTRDMLMPRMAGTPLPLLKDALGNYIALSGRRVSLEYLLIGDITDDSEHLEALVAFCAGLKCHVNLLPVNEVGESPLKPADGHTMLRWERELARRGVGVSIRNSRGADIDGACGQLRNRTR